MHNRTNLIFVFVVIFVAAKSCESISLFEYGRAFFMNRHPEHWKPRRCKCPEGYQCRIYADGLERWPHVCEKKYPKMPPHLRNSTQSTSPDEILDEES